jgi:hypothetical protein
MKKIIFLLPLMILVSGCQTNHLQQVVPPQPVACPTETKLCPDGSAVSRTQPGCAFAECPVGIVSTSTPPVESIVSGISGVSLLGPTCPVEKIPPDPACAPKPYPALILVKTPDGKREISSFRTDQDGKFSVNLPSDSYLLEPQSGQVFPRGISQLVTVKPGAITTITINFDSGIR